MPNTDHLQILPDFFSSKEEGKSAVRQNTNPRYKFFRQTHFTAGDYEQFLEYWDRQSHQRIIENDTRDHIQCPLYQNISSDDVFHTFEYIFHKFKKGIFVKIINNEVRVFLPFSKIDYINEWSDRIRVQSDKYPMGIFSLFERCNERFQHDRNKVHYMMDHWYANNGLLRYEYPISENDSGVSTIRDMFLELVRERDVPDCEFFINKRDFPILRRDGMEAYEAIFGATPMCSHNYERYCPILGMTSTSDHADIPIPTWDDWARVCFPKKMFGKDFIDYPDIVQIPFHEKKPCAVFRGASTGLGTTPETNPRLMFSLLSLENRTDVDGIPFLDCGITKWNLRPRRVNEYYDTIDPEWIDKIPLAPFLTPQEQSHYKYIIHLPGHSEAYRLSTELGMGSVILKYPCKYQLWYSHKLEPYVHFVPLDKDPKDVFEKIRWCKSHERECEIIASNARRFYETYLSRDGILDHLRDVLCNVQRQTGLISYPTKNLQEFQYDIQKNFLSIENNILTNKIIFPIQSHADDLTHLSKRAFQIVLHQLPHQDVMDLIQSAPIIKQSRNMNLRTIIVYGKTLCVKTPLNSCEKTLAHECFVGQMSLNRVANCLPFVNYTYGRWGDHIIFDYIDDGATFEKMLNDIPTRDVIDFFVSILCQLSIILQFLQSEYGFIHYDCYPWNIMIRKNIHKTEFIIPCGMQSIRFCPEYYPVLIDFGKSHVVYQNLHFVNVSPFHLHLHQDIISILIAGLSIILSKHKLHRTDIMRSIHLINYLGKTSYTGYCKFENLPDMKNFIKTRKKYSNMLLNDKNDYKDLQPIRIFSYLSESQRFIWNNTDPSDILTVMDIHYTRFYILYDLNHDKATELFINERLQSPIDGHNPLYLFFKTYINYCLCQFLCPDAQDGLLDRLESIGRQEWSVSFNAHSILECHLPRLFSHPDITKTIQGHVSNNHYSEKHKILLIILHATMTIPRLVFMQEKIIALLHDFLPGILVSNRAHSIYNHLSRYRKWLCP